VVISAAKAQELADLREDPTFKALQVLKRTLYTHDLYSFLTECLGVDARATPLVTDPGVKELVRQFGKVFVDWLRERKKTRDQGKLAWGAFRKVMVVVPRECMKSTTVTQAAPVLASIWDPDIAIAVSSYKQEKVATKFGEAIRNHWAGLADRSQLVPLFGTFKDPKNKLPWSETAAVISCRKATTRPDPTLRIFSVETGGTSGHYDLVILDDPVTQEKNAEGWEEKVWEHYKSLGMVTNQDGMFVLVMTRYGDGDLVGKIIEREIETATREADLPNAPAGELPDDWDYETGWQKYAHLAGWTVFYKHGFDGDIKSDNPEDYTLHFPVAWPRDKILARLLTDQLFVMAQVQNQPSRRTDADLTREQIEAAWVDKAPAGAYTDLTMHCDIAWKDGESYMKQRGDYNVIQIWGHYEGHAYMVWGARGRWKQEEWGDKIVEAYDWIKSKRHRRLRDVTWDKPTGGIGGAIKNYYDQVLKKAGHRPVQPTELTRAGTKKLNRLREAAAFWADGYVHLVRGVNGTKELAYQMLRLGYSKYDDDADAAADVWHEKVFRSVRRESKDPVSDSEFLRRLRPVARGHVGMDGSWVPETVSGRRALAEKRISELYGIGREPGRWI